MVCGNATYLDARSRGRLRQAAACSAAITAMVRAGPALAEAPKSPAAEWPTRQGAARATQILVRLPREASTKCSRRRSTRLRAAPAGRRPRTRVPDGWPPDTRPRYDQQHARISKLKPTSAKTSTFPVGGARRPDNSHCAPIAISTRPVTAPRARTGLTHRMTILLKPQVRPARRPRRSVGQPARATGACASR